MEHKSTPEISTTPVHDNAYVWLLMKGDSYLPGIFTSVYSILRTNPDADLVIMVTPDVSTSAKEILMKVATHLFYIDYISIDSKPLKSQKQRELYAKWVSVAYTKWNMLAVPYKKALFVDGDTIVLDNIDYLFKMQTPAAPFNNPFVKPLGYIKDYLIGQRGSDNYLVHGAKITPKVVNDCLNKDGMLFTASAVLLSPNFDDYFSYLKMLKTMEPFGFTKCHSMVDEQSLAYFYSDVKKVDWYNIHQVFNYINWKEGFLAPNDTPIILHYFSEKKPWVMKYNEWPDVICWYKMAAESLEKTHSIPVDIKLDTEQIKLAKTHKDEWIKKYTGKLKNVSSCLDLIGKLQNRFLDS
jgi:lipopolysaccharide biosynthesis glycosyltransferase